MVYLETGFASGYGAACSAWGMKCVALGICTCCSAQQARRFVKCVALHLQRAASLNAPRGSRAPRYSARTVVSPDGEAAQAARQDLSPRPRRCGASSFWSCGRGSRLAPVRQRKNTSSELLRRHREEDAASATAMARVRARAIVGAGTPTRGAAWRLARPRVAWVGPRTRNGTPGGVGMEFIMCNG